ncbi:carbohydrate ABC transporter permease [Meiothermus sp. PNK-Is4]|nr:carbohydrate ABC transporter permease [Meiothermus sp. Pnk-1]RYM37243.1 carbohydrate ABC transporter permease [Meiothermus sp. PNK-Is4]
MLLPFLWMLSTSLKPASAVLSLPPELLPREPTLEAYREVARSFPIVRVFLNTLLVAAATTLGQLVVSSMSGYAFARFRFAGRDLLFAAYLATLMVPFAVTVTPLFIVVKALGWTNSYWGLVVPALFGAFGTFLMRQFFLALPGELEEAAVLDGASTFTTFARVMLPLSGPALATLGVFSFMASWNSFLWPLLIVNDPRLMTLPLALATLQGLYPGQTQWNLVMAGTVIAVIPMVVVFLLAQRWVVEGVTVSGLKG